MQRSRNCRPVPFGPSLVMATFHFNVSQPIVLDKDAFLAEWESGHTPWFTNIVRAYGGCGFSEHALGRLKGKKLMPHIKSDAGNWIMMPPD